MNSEGFDIGDSDEKNRGHGERPQRLRRLDRLFVSHPLYFVTTCIEDRKPILANPTVHDAFRRFCEAGLERGVYVGKYVLMPDHLHLFVTFDDEYGASGSDGGHRQSLQGPLSEWMKSFKNSLSKTLRRMNVPAPHWQKGFFDHVMRSEGSYSEKWMYVAENPRREKLVVRIEDWPYQGEICLLEARGHL